VYADSYANGWTWYTGMGHPSGVQFASNPAVINYGTGENVFVSGADGNLYADSYNSSNSWVWNTTLGNGGFAGNSAAPASATQSLLVQQGGSALSPAMQPAAAGLSPASQAADTSAAVVPSSKARDGKDLLFAGRAHARPLGEALGLLSDTEMDLLAKNLAGTL
jgi:hypothetical protein